ncbi:MAG TPA: SWIM zinc finger family protein [Planctomycetaceae bacterium]|nr:SWIM zinc finger family protein [Planctomycetaceae bacterium]
MSATTIGYTYRYPFESAVEVQEAAPRVRMATSLDETSDDLFFDGKLRRPAVVGQMLSVLCDVVRTRFYQKLDPMVLDPVVTSGGGMLRFEGFSSCCGVYARVDLPPAAFDVDLRGKGTTNVDFNNPMRAALRRMSDRDEASFQVGGRGVALTKGAEKIIERKVKLPVRWIKGFCEVQAYQPRLVPHFELAPLEARELFRTLPKSNARQGWYITKAGRTYRVSPSEKPGTVRVEGADRVRVLEPLIASARSLQIFYDEESQTSGWQIESEVGRFFALISPELNRGFSGEGQMLERLATGEWQTALPSVAEALNWQSHIDAVGIGSRAGLSEGAVEAALAVLGARGLAGYDVSAGRYFHRVLPFDLEKVEQLQPRLKNARALVDRVVIVAQNGADVDATVPGSDFDQYVRLRPDGNKCTCQWFSRYQGQRGACKHILAVRMKVEGVQEVTDDASRTELT